ncbi:MAG: hypothetical protein QF662_08670, partial [Phycisphaerae bacterium]|nr:hypothetical protein [Phycisphaerae bacterium]
MMVFLVIVCVAMGALAVYALVNSVRPWGRDKPPRKWATYKCTAPGCGHVFNKVIEDKNTEARLSAQSPAIR